MAAINHLVDLSVEDGVGKQGLLHVGGRIEVPLALHKQHGHLDVLDLPGDHTVGPGAAEQHRMSSLARGMAQRRHQMALAQAGP